MSEFDRLKDLLLSDERAARARQSADFDAKLDATFADLPNALPELLRRAQTDDRLARALEAPLSKGLERLARTQKSLLISVLFPLIGPVIRRSIAETLSQLMKDMNRAVEHSVSPTGLRWRWEAMRTGVPFTQVVLKHTLRYRVEHLLLVNNDGGLLLAHVANTNAELADSDAVAGMLSALQDFARDAVFAHADESLNAVEVGGMTLKILRGPLMHLAVAVRGELSEAAHVAQLELLEALHVDQNSAEALEENRAEFQADMSDWLLKNGQQSSEAADHAKTGVKAKPVLLWLALTAALLGLLYWLGMSLWHAHLATRLQMELAKSPGILATVDYQDGTYRVRGSRDPMADTVQAAAQRAGVTAQSVDTSLLSPYLSLEPELWVRRLRQNGHLPATLALSSANGRLSISGELTSTDLDNLRQKLLPWQALLAFDMSSIRLANPLVTAERLRLMRELAQLHIKFGPGGGVPGTAPDSDAAFQTLTQHGKWLLASAPEQHLRLTLLARTQAATPENKAQTVRLAQEITAALGAKRVTIRIVSGQSRPGEADYCVLTQTALYLPDLPL
jgi:hypothetical protein